MPCCDGSGRRPGDPGWVSTGDARRRPPVRGTPSQETVLLQAGGGGIIANPNCSTIIALMAVTPLHRAKTVKRMVVSTYQAASGAGQAAMDELEAQTKAVLEGSELPMEIFPFQYAFNLFSHNAPMQDNGYNEEVRPPAPALPPPPRPPSQHAVAEPWPR